MVALNVTAVHELTLAFVPAMVQRRAGAILNVASLAAFQPLPDMATYAATKAFVQSFSEALHAELAGTGVSCTTLCPGPSPTEFGAVAGPADSEWTARASPRSRPRTSSAPRSAACCAAGARSSREWRPRRSPPAAACAPRSVLLPAARKALTGGASALSRASGRREQLRRDAVGRVARPAEQPPAQLRAAEEQRGVVLPRRADPAVGDDVLAGGEVERASRRPSAPRSRRGELLGPVVEGPARVVQQRAGVLLAAQDLGQAVLDRLVGADRATEREALLGVRDGHLERGLHRTERLGGQHRLGQVPRAGELLRA